MAIINEIITQSGGTLSFGDYLCPDKKKFNDFELAGDLYSVKTHNLITRLEKNGSLLLETVPGATVHGLDVSEKLISFGLEGFEDTQVTMELEPETEYAIYIDGVNVGKSKSSKSGKVNFSIELSEKPQGVRIEKL